MELSIYWKGRGGLSCLNLDNFFLKKNLFKKIFTGNLDFIPLKLKFKRNNNFLYIKFYL